MIYCPHVASVAQFLPSDLLRIAHRWLLAVSEYRLDIGNTFVDILHLSTVLSVKGKLINYSYKLVYI